MIHRTLDTKQIDEIIAVAMARETMKAEIERRALRNFPLDWKADARVTSGVRGKAYVAQSGREVAV
jgi:hypothetical protein